jgi:hypothetical protein
VVRFTRWGSAVHRAPLIAPRTHWCASVRRRYRCQDDGRPLLAQAASHALSSHTARSPRHGEDVWNAGMSPCAAPATPTTLSVSDAGANVCWERGSGAGSKSAHRAFAEQCEGLLHQVNRSFRRSGFGQGMPRRRTGRFKCSSCPRGGSRLCVRSFELKYCISWLAPVARRLVSCRYRPGQRRPTGRPLSLHLSGRTGLRWRRHWT